MFASAYGVVEAMRIAIDCAKRVVRSRDSVSDHDREAICNTLDLYLDIQIKHLEGYDVPRMDQLGYGDDSVRSTIEN